MGFFSKRFGSKPVTPERTKPQTQPGPSGGKSVLVVDPSVTVRKVIELTLSGQHILTAASMAEATSLIGRAPLRAVISALVLPDGTGYQVCRHAKAAGVPAILTRGVFEEFDETHAVESGVDAVITKPFRSDDLRAVFDGLP